MGQVFSFYFPMIQGVYIETNTPKKYKKLQKEKSPNKKEKLYCIPEGIDKVYIKVAMPPRVARWTSTVKLNDVEVEKNESTKIQPFFPTVIYYPVNLQPDTTKLHFQIDYISGAVFIGGAYIPNVEFTKIEATFSRSINEIEN